MEGKGAMSCAILKTISKECANSGPGPAVYIYNEGGLDVISFGDEDEAISSP